MEPSISSTLLVQEGAIVRLRQELKPIRNPPISRDSSPLVSSGFYSVEEQLFRLTTLEESRIKHIFLNEDTDPLTNERQTIIWMYQSHKH